MQGVKGNDKFEGAFDFFEWSAPYYLTPYEVAKALNSIDLKAKKIKSINVIGYVEGADKGLVYRRIRDAGIHADDNWIESYPHLNKVMVPWKVSACEPIQFVFDDDSTLEILPIGDGGARIGINTIPAGLSEGLNHSNFKAVHFFAKAIGKKIKEIDVRIEKKTQQDFGRYWLDSETPHEETRTKYRICLDLDYPFEMELVQTWESWYTIEMHGSGWDNQIPYSRVNASFKNIKQIRIINGRDCNGVFWIVPISSDEEARDEQFFVDNYGISIDDDKVLDFLGDFLRRYFDPSIQDDTGDYYEDGKRAFDDFGVNLYTFDSMREILREISNAISMLENDFGNPQIAKIRNNLPWFQHTDKHKNELSDAQINALRKKCVPETVDFYKRFIKRMEAMMRLPKRDIISFAGP